ncbi:MAG: hypothetical protein IH899_03275 [Planctomycetes bacterium]|nr:hypothetical protein [Planctomycetota bacterium]
MAIRTKEYCDVCENAFWNCRSLKETDIEYVLARFEDGFNQSMIQNKIIIDTSSATVDQSVGELVENIGSYLTQRDRIRMLTKDF